MATAITYGYLPRRRASTPFGQYQFILLDDRGTCVNHLPVVVTWQWKVDLDFDALSSHVHCRTGNLSETAQDGNFVTRYCRQLTWPIEIAPFLMACDHHNHSHTITITIRYLYSAPYNIGQRRWTRKKLIELNKKCKMKWCHITVSSYILS